MGHAHTMGLHGVAESVAEVADIVVVIVCDPFAGGAEDGSRLHGGGGFDLVRLACYFVVGDGRQLVSSVSEAFEGWSGQQLRRGWYEPAQL